MTLRDKFLLQPDKALLLIVDVQDRLCAAMAQDALQKRLKNTGILLQGANELGVPVLFSEQYPKGLGPTLPELKAQVPDVHPCEKLSFSCCGDTGFLGLLEQSGRTQIIVCGMEAHVCVQQTVIDLLGAGYIVHVVGDAVLSRSNDNRQTALQAMTLAGAVPTSTESVLFQLLKVAGTDTFRKLSKLVK